MNYYLLALIAAPLAAAGLSFLASGKDGDSANRIGIALSLVVAVLALPLVTCMPAPALTLPWFTLWGTGATVTLALASDGLSGWLIQLAAWLTPVALIAARRQVGRHMREFVACILLCEAFIIGALLARDLVVFYLCYEAMLVPMLVIIALLGGEDRRTTALWFFIYTMAGSAFMLVGIWYLAAALQTTDLARVVAGLAAPPSESAAHMLTPAAKGWLFTAFVLAFAVKVPLVPLHGWQARTYAETPGAAVVILGGVMSKLGLYGFLRFVLPMFPDLCARHAGLFTVLALIAVVGGALVAMAQDDAKRMLAYSSLSHLGLVMAGIFSFDEAALRGAALQMVAHGLSVAALFVLVGAVEARTRSVALDDFGGLANKAPLFALLFTCAALASAALPGTLNFAGEFALLLGLWRGAGPWTAAIAGLAVILGAVYLLVLLQKWLYGRARTGGPEVAELGWAETVAVVPLLIALLVLGLRPAPVADSAGAVCAALGHKAAAARQLQQRAGCPAAIGAAVTAAPVPLPGLGPVAATIPAR
ncbi:MAG: NADH-quinone oxidoreductase subunit M [Planctomycetes bacterium]|nr:NADH-quinone oxidoreductase subunit M [Planctomycetota bacterium]